MGLDVLGEKPHRSWRGDGWMGERVRAQVTVRGGGWGFPAQVPPEAERSLEVVNEMINLKLLLLPFLLVRHVTSSSPKVS